MLGDQVPENVKSQETKEAQVRHKHPRFRRSIPTISDQGSLAGSY